MALGMLIHPTFGQGFLKKMKDKAANTLQDRVLQKADDSLNKQLDQLEGKSQQREPASAGQNGEALPQASAPSKEKMAIRYFTKYDFVPGEEVIYGNTFESDELGELPVGWNSNGKSVVVKLDSLPGNWLRMSQQSLCLTDNTEAFGENFTFEFDVLMQFDFKGWYPPNFRFGLFASGDASPGDNRFLSDPVGDQSVYLDISPLSNGANLRLESYQNHNRYFHSPTTSFPLLHALYGKVFHVAIDVQTERLRLWLNGEKVYDLPKALAPGSALNQLYYSLGSSPYQDEQIGVYVSQIKIAKGLSDTKASLLTAGKFSTTGILFDSGKAIVKPASAGVLAAVANTLTENPDLKLTIIGHTDSDGNANSNLELSASRARAVMESLVSDFKVQGDRLVYEGRGAGEPVADNHTKEGKMQNRRVEFVKL